MEFWRYLVFVFHLHRVIGQSASLEETHSRSECPVGKEAIYPTKPSREQSQELNALIYPGQPNEDSVLKEDSSGVERAIQEVFGTSDSEVNGPNGEEDHMYLQTKLRTHPLIKHPILHSIVPHKTSIISELLKRKLLYELLRPKHLIHHKVPSILRSTQVGSGGENEDSSDELLQQILESRRKDNDENNDLFKNAFLTETSSYNITDLKDKKLNQGFHIEKKKNVSVNLKFLDSNGRYTNYSDSHSSSLQTIIENTPEEQVSKNISYEAFPTNSYSHEKEKSYFSKSHYNNANEKEFKNGVYRKGMSEASDHNCDHSARQASTSNDQDIVGLSDSLTKQIGRNDFVGSQFLENPTEHELSKINVDSSIEQKGSSGVGIKKSESNKNNKGFTDLNVEECERRLPPHFLGGQFIPTSIQNYNAKETSNPPYGPEQTYDFVGGQFVQHKHKENGMFGETSDSLFESVGIQPTEKYDKHSDVILGSLNMENNEKTATEHELSQTNIETSKQSDMIISSYSLEGNKGMQANSEDFTQVHSLEEENKLTNTEDGLLALYATQKSTENENNVGDILSQYITIKPFTERDQVIISQNAIGSRSDIKVSEEESRETYGNEGVYMDPILGNSNVQDQTEVNHNSETTTINIIKTQDDSNQVIEKDTVFTSNSKSKFNKAISEESNLQTGLNEELPQENIVDSGTILANASITAIPTLNTANKYSSVDTEASSNSNPLVDNLDSRPIDYKSPEPKESIIYNPADNDVSVGIGILSTPDEEAPEQAVVLGGINNISHESHTTTKVGINSEIQQDYSDSSEKMTTTKRSIKETLDSSESDEYLNSNDDILGFPNTNEQLSILGKDPITGDYITERYIQSYLTEASNVDNKRNDDIAGEVTEIEDTSDVSDTIIGEFSNLQPEQLNSFLPGTHASNGSKLLKEINYQGYTDRKPTTNVVELYAGSNKSETKFGDSCAYPINICHPVKNTQVSLLDLLSGQLYLEKDGKKLPLSMGNNPMEDCNSGSSTCRLFFNFKEDSKTVETNSETKGQQKDTNLVLKSKTEKRHIADDDKLPLKLYNIIQKETEALNLYNTNVATTDIVTEEQPLFKQKCSDDLNNELLSQQSEIGKEKLTPNIVENLNPKTLTSDAPSRFILSLVPDSGSYDNRDVKDIPPNENYKSDELSDQLNGDPTIFYSSDGGESSHGFSITDRFKVGNKNRNPRTIYINKEVPAAIDGESEKGKCNCNSGMLQSPSPVPGYQHFVRKRLAILTNIVHAVKDWVVESQ